MMILSEDILVLVVGIFAFVLFLIAHFILFRYLKPEQLFKGIVGVFGLVLILATGGSLLVFGFHVDLVLLSLAIYTISAYVYILCFFGPYETSIRMRLIRELSRQPACSLNDLLKSYNTAVILDTRLKRLLGSGDIVKNGESFRIAKNHNAFFFIDAIARKLHAFIHAS